MSTDELLKSTENTGALIAEEDDSKLVIGWFFLFLLKATALK